MNVVYLQANSAYVCVYNGEILALEAYDPRKRLYSELSELDYALQVSGLVRQGSNIVSVPGGNEHECFKEVR